MRDGHSHAAAAVGAQREVHPAEAGGDGDGRTAGGTPRDASTRGGIDGSSVVRVLAVDAVRELVHVRHADARGAGIRAQRHRASGDRRAIVRRHPRGRAEAGDATLYVEDVLNHELHALQGSLPGLAVGLGGRRRHRRQVDEGAKRIAIVSRRARRAAVSPDLPAPFLPFFARKRAPMDTAPATMSARSTIEPDRVRRRGAARMWEPSGLRLRSANTESPWLSSLMEVNRESVTHRFREDHKHARFEQIARKP